MQNKYPYLYAVSTSEGDFVKAYTRFVWARRKAYEIGGKVETYINKNYRFGVEMAEYMTREER